ncbi:hypothetical protein HJC23_013907 [Cyclotella cryptica]|uniref:Uncharacterized protein n=1 Tax=Cyclotella cryptica TaxID=29204 RepID=A0ABD3QGG0_9STRA|eukprot:CCRYP_005483-RA/>CCRYP_005483-RA protein AED:0.17 eAED:0.17 QI:0/-1/0/1/-1/1/1/0/638
MAEERKQPRKILTEEDYTSTLTHIVTRDYFPSLYSLQRDAAILEARSRGDVASAVAIRREARREELEREREWAEDQAEERGECASMEEALALAGETAVAKLSVDKQGVLTRKRPRPLKHESITGFHARVTSEDNAEFESNQDQESRQREIALGVIYSASADKSGRLLIESCVNDNPIEFGSANANKRALLGCETPLGLASDLYNASPSAGLRITANETKPTRGIARNALFFQPQHHDDQGNIQSTKGSLLLESSTTAPSSGGKFLSLTNGDSAVDNLLMPPPPARNSTSENGNNVKQLHYELSTSQLVEYQAKPLIPRINPPATRFPYQMESRLLSTKSVPCRARNGRGIDGATSDATTDLDEVPLPLDLERAARREAAMRECETFVPMTPLIQPGRGDMTVDGAADEPIMTWGTVASTPLVLGSGVAVDKRNNVDAADWEPTRPATSILGVENDSSGGTAFDVVEENSREKLARRAEKTLNDRAKTYRSAGTIGLAAKSSARSTAQTDDASTVSRASSKTVISSFDRTASLTPAAQALFEATSKARNVTQRSGSRSLSASTSRIFQPSPVSSKDSTSILHAGSRNSFGSALRMAYTQSSTPSSDRKNGKGRDKNSLTSSSLLRRAAEGGTPRCHSLR